MIQLLNLLPFHCVKNLLIIISTALLPVCYSPYSCCTFIPLMDFLVLLSTGGIPFANPSILPSTVRSGPSSFRGKRPSAHVVPPIVRNARPRKDRQPNWSPVEISTLIAAKREQYFEELDAIDGHDLMNPDATKWVRISQLVMASGQSPCMRDGSACKAKWNQIIPDYKRIADFHARTGQNAANYWELSSTEHITDGLPKSFSRDLYDQIHEWYGSRPQIQPPHTRDLLSTQDGNHPGIHKQGASDDEGSGASEPETEEASIANLSQSQQAPSSPHSCQAPSFQQEVGQQAQSARATSSPALRTPQGSGFGMPSRRTPIAPVQAQAPIYISSTDTSDYSTRRRSGNTGQRRKSLSGHNVIAEATKASGDIMATQMKDMAAASRDLELSKIEVQLKLFSEQMAYQREKDRRLYENAVIANENAKLSIMKQGEVVSCLQNLSNVLRMGMNVTGKSDQGSASKDPTSTAEALEHATPSIPGPSSTFTSEEGPSSG
jgi:hypothetical protein